MIRAPTISLRYAHRVIETACAHGALRAALERPEYLTSVERASDARITAAQYFGLWGAAMEQVQDPAFPLRVAAATGIETHELFGFVCMTRPIFRDALAGASRDLQIWTNLARWELRPEKAFATLLLVPGTDRHPAARFAAECMLIASSLGSGTFTLEAIASRLAMSSRTLRRRLEVEGQPFDALVEQTRSALAKRHLREGRLALGEIAFVLGFSDATAFHRFFRRSTGLTPSAYRQQVPT